MLTFRFVPLLLTGSWDWDRDRFTAGILIGSITAIGANSSKIFSGQNSEAGPNQIIEAVIEAVLFLCLNSIFLKIKIIIKIIF